MTKNGDLKLQSLSNGDILLTSQNGRIFVETRGQKKDLLTQLELVEALSGQICFLTPQIPEPTWNLLAPMPFPAWAISSVVVGTQIYVFGGNDGTKALKNVRIFDTITNQWTMAPEMNEGRAGAFVGVLDNKEIVVVGGHTANNIGEAIAEVTSYEVFDLETQSWKKFEYDENAPSHLLAASAQVGNKIYVFGSKRGGLIDAHTSSFDLETKTWASLDEMPIPKFQSTAVVAGSKIFLLGGMVFPSFGNDPHWKVDEVEVFDTAISKWENGTRIALPRSGIGAAYMSGLIFEVGGQSEFLAAHGNTNVLSIRTNRWRTEFFHELHQARHLFALQQVDGVLYAIGGKNGTSLTAISEVESIRPCF